MWWMPIFCQLVATLAVFARFTLPFINLNNKYTGRVMWEKMLTTPVVKLPSRGLTSFVLGKPLALRQHKDSQQSCSDAKQNQQPIRTSSQRRKHVKTQSSEQGQLCQSSPRGRECYSKAETDWMAKAIQYKNELQSVKTRLFAAEFQIGNLEGNTRMLVSGERERAEKRVLEMRGKLEERDRQIREKDELILKLINITRNL